MPLPTQPVQPVQPVRQAVPVTNPLALGVPPAVPPITAPTFTPPAVVNQDTVLGSPGSPGSPAPGQPGSPASGSPASGSPAPGSPGYLGSPGSPGSPASDSFTAEPFTDPITGAYRPSPSESGMSAPLVVPAPALAYGATYPNSIMPLVIPPTSTYRGVAYVRDAVQTYLAHNQVTGEAKDYLESFLRDSLAHLRNLDAQAASVGRAKAAGKLAAQSSTDDKVVGNLPDPPLFIAKTDLPEAQVGRPYSFALSPTGGLTPHKWWIRSGSTGGLTLSAAGVLFGTPTAVGDYSFDVEVGDSAGLTASEVLSLHVIAYKA